MLGARLPWSSLRTLSQRQYLRWVSTLPNNPYIHVLPTSQGPKGNSVLSYLNTDPPNPKLAIGTTTEVPPSPETFTANNHFLKILQDVVTEHATKDPDIQAQAKAFASTGGSGLGSGGGFFPQQRSSRRKQTGSETRSGRIGTDGASGQGGMGGASVGGWVHVSDQRNPPDWGRIAYPEDIFGSLQVDGDGQFVGINGSYQSSGTYRIITRDGILGLSPYLRERLIERLKQLEMHE